MDDCYKYKFVLKFNFFITNKYFLFINIITNIVLFCIFKNVSTHIFKYLM